MRIQDYRDPLLVLSIAFVVVLTTASYLFAANAYTEIQALQAQNAELKAELQNVAGTSSTALHKCYIADPSVLDKLNLDENWVILGWLPGPGTVPLICPKG